VVQYLVSKGARNIAPGEDVTEAQAPKFEYQPLDLTNAAKKNNVDVVSAIMKERPEWASNKDDNGWMALHEASARGHFDVVQVLVELGGANVNARTAKGGSESGGSVLFWTQRNFAEDHPVVQYLVSKGARNIAPGEDVTEAPVPTFNFNAMDLRQAAMTNDVEVISAILKERPDWCNERDKNGWQPLHEAAARGNLEAARLLVEQGGADVNGRTKSGRGGSVLYWAFRAIGQDHPVSDYLVSQGAESIEPAAEQEL